MMRITVIIALVTPVLMCVPVGLLAAQAPEQTGCAESSAAVQRGTRQATDIERLGACPQSGGRSLATLWQHAASLSMDQHAALRSASVHLRDGRVYVSVRTLVGDVAKPTLDRLAGLQVMTSYFDRRLLPSIEDLRSPRGGVIPRVAHTTMVSGAVPLPATLPAEFLGQLAELAWTDPDPQVRSAALYLRQALAFDHPSETPLKPGVFALVAGCGSRVMLRSTADVTVPIDLQVGNAAEVRSYALAPASNAKVSQVLLSLPPGPIHATVAGRTVAMLQVRNAPCKPGEVP